MSIIAKRVIQVIHFLFVLFVLFTPFIGGQLLLTYHFITIPFMLFHWVTNNDTCALSLLESVITGNTEDKTFIGRIVKPIYNGHIQSKHYYWICALLFAITTYRLYQQYDFQILRIMIDMFFGNLNIKMLTNNNV